MIVRKKIRYNVDQRKKIKAGYKGKDDLPKRTDWFVVKHPETGEEYFPELIEMYGEKPDKLFITFPGDNLEDFYEDRYVQWGSNNVKKRVCDSVECSFFLDQTIAKEKFSAGKDYECICNKLNLFNTEDKELKKHACRVDMYLKAMILNPKNMKPISPICYLFESHSKNSADNIFSELSRYKRLSGFPFVITMKMVKGVNRSFPIMNVFPHITSDQLIEYNLNMTMEIESGNQHLLPESCSVDEETGEEITNAEVINEEEPISEEVKGIVKSIKECMTLKALENLRNSLSGKKFNAKEKKLLSLEAEKVTRFIESEMKENEQLEQR